MNSKSLYRCGDLAVNCHRFLDIASPIYLGGRPQRSLRNNFVNGIDDESATELVKDGYTGCIANLTFDGVLYHFSELDRMEKRGNVIAGCHQMRNECEKNPCDNTSKCIVKWDGHNCRCPHRLHQHGPCETGNIAFPLFISFRLVYENKMIILTVHFPFIILLLFHHK